MKTLFIKGNLHVNGRCSGKNITCYGGVENEDNSFVINGNVTIEGDVILNDEQAIIATGGISCTK